jgi:hypothetical protein
MRRFAWGTASGLREKKALAIGQISERSIDHAEYESAISKSNRRAKGGCHAVYLTPGNKCSGLLRIS